MTDHNMFFLGEILEVIPELSLKPLFIWSTTVQGPIVQSIVSLTSLLRGQLVKCFTIL